MNLVQSCTILTFPRVSPCRYNHFMCKIDRVACHTAALSRIGLSFLQFVGIAMQIWKTWVQNRTTVNISRLRMIADVKIPLKKKKTLQRLILRRESIINMININTFLFNLRASILCSFSATVTLISVRSRSILRKCFRISANMCEEGLVSAIENVHIIVNAMYCRIIPSDMEELLLKRVCKGCPKYIRIKSGCYHWS